MRLTTITLAALLLFAGGANAQTTIEWWQFWTDPAVKPVIEQMVEAFEKANPDINVEVTDLTWANGHEKIVLAFSSGRAPDVVELGSDWIAQFADNGQLADMSAMIAADSADYHGWSLSTYNNNVYAHPWILGTRVVFGNRDLLNRAGYEDDFFPLAWPQFTQAAKDVHALSSDIYGWGSNTAEKHRLYKKYLPFFWSAGAQIFSDEGEMCVIASDPAIKALQTYKELHDSCGYVDTQRGIEDAFLEGKIGFILSGDWLLKRIELENRDINLMSTLVPGPKFPGKSFLGGEFLSISQQSDNKEAAMKLIRFITAPENQVLFCKANRSANPSSRQAQEDPYFSSSMHLQTFVTALQTAKHPPVDPDWVYIEDIIESAVEDALFGQGLPGEALLDARYQIEEVKGME